MQTLAVELVLVVEVLILQILVVAVPVMVAMTGTEKQPMVAHSKQVCGLLADVEHRKDLR